MLDQQKGESLYTGLRRLVTYQTISIDVEDQTEECVYARKKRKDNMETFREKLLS